MTEPVKLISIMKILLAELEQSLSSSPHPMKENDSRTDQMKLKIDRLDAALKKRQSADRRKRELEKQNRENSRNC